ncbi:MAG TPA: hypothetical protein VMW69_10425 [Spirochaetia bacterium]|nr:hypothetical protein [Spirochaetia bacterium]
MSLQRQPGMGQARRDLGSTLVEALFALIAITLVVPCAVFASRELREGLLRARRIAEMDDRIMRTDRLLRETVQRVLFPMNLAEVPFRHTGGNLQLPYFDARPAEHLEISVREDRLILRTPKGAQSVDGLKGLRIAFSSGLSGPPVVCITFQDEGGGNVSLLAAPGSWPLQRTRSRSIALP